MEQNDNTEHWLWLYQRSWLWMLSIFGYLHFNAMQIKATSAVAYDFNQLIYAVCAPPCPDLRLRPLPCPTDFWPWPALPRKKNLPRPSLLSKVLDSLYSVIPFRYYWVFRGGSMLVGLRRALIGTISCNHAHFQRVLINIMWPETWPQIFLDKKNIISHIEYRIAFPRYWQNCW